MRPSPQALNSFSKRYVCLLRNQFMKKLRERLSKSHELFSDHLEQKKLRSAQFSGFGAV